VDTADIRLATRESQVVEIVHIRYIERCVKGSDRKSGEGMIILFDLFLDSIDIPLPLRDPLFHCGSGFPVI
jgi:hypothetical protein